MSRVLIPLTVLDVGVRATIGSINGVVSVCDPVQRREAVLVSSRVGGTDGTEHGGTNSALPAYIDSGAGAGETGANTGLLTAGAVALVAAAATGWIVVSRRRGDDH